MGDRRRPGEDRGADMTTLWPDIPYAAWKETRAALHLFTQVVGKYRLARTPWVNHSWHATLYLDGRGLTTALVPDGQRGVEIELDLLEHAVVGTATDGGRASFSLEPMSVAEFHARFVDLLRGIGATPEFHGRPNEIPGAIPFREDRQRRPYDPAAVTRFFQALVGIERVLSRFRTAFLGKVSPVHLFWGSFDLAVTRFSGRPAPPHPGGIPELPDEVTREAYSHEVSSAGFWPGDEKTQFATFYSYAYPVPAGFAESGISPETAYFDRRLGEFVLDYDRVRQAADPEAVLLTFLESTYRAAADLGGWDRGALECPLGEPSRPRPLGRPSPG
jgi:hypothetical protein